MRLALSALALLAVAAVPTAAFAGTIDLSTGTASYNYTTSAGNPYPTPGSTTLSPVGTTSKVAPYQGIWSAPIGSSSWISPTPFSSNGQATDATANTYFSFFTNAGVAVNGETVSGSFLSDNAATVYLFDTTTNKFLNAGFSNASAASTFNTPATAFSFSGLTSGDTYQLVGIVFNGYTNAQNTGNPVGLDIQGTAVTPEPSSVALLGTGLAGIAGFARRRMRS